MVPFSILDLSPIPRGSEASDALRNTLDLAQHAERWGYRRFWLAEHHNMPGIASAATAVAIAHVGGGTSKIRIGSGGIMLPNHSPLVIAEQFGTLESLFPGRVDLGVGRAPGTDQQTTRALRRERMGSADTFPQDLIELQAYFRPAVSGQAVRAVPGAGLNIPIWLLGSSLFSAELAASLGLPYAFAGHFAPDQMIDAFDIYRRRFQASESLDQPYTMAGVSVIAAETDTEARRLFTSLQQQFISLRLGTPGPLPPPIDHPEITWSPIEKATLNHTLREAIVGSRETIRAGFESFLARTGVDEIMVTAQIFDHSARLRSFEIVSEVRETLADARASSVQA